MIITIADKTFSSKKQLTEYVRDILRHYSTEHDPFLFELIRYHPKYLEKTQLHVVGFQVFFNNKSNGLNLVHEDGSRTNLSWLNCIRNYPKYNYTRLQEAAFRTLEPIYVSVMQQQLSESDRCHACQTVLEQDTICIDYQSDPFPVIDLFFKDRKIEYIEKNQQYYFEDEELQEEWRQYALEHLMIHISCKECRSDKSKTGKPDSEMTC